MGAKTTSFHSFKMTTNRLGLEKISCGRSYLDEDQHAGNEYKAHVECQELQQRQREAAFVTAPFYSWTCSAKEE